MSPGHIAIFTKVYHGMTKQAIFLMNGEEMVLLNLKI